MKVVSIQEVKNRCDEVNSHFFDRDTMKWFNSRVSNWAYKTTDGKIYFVTSEKCSFSKRNKRRYKVRVSSPFPKTTIDTVKELPTYKEVHTEAQKLADEK